MALALSDCYAGAGRQLNILVYLSLPLPLSFCYLREPHQPRTRLRCSSLFSSVSVVSRCSPTALCHSPLVLLHTVPQFAANKQKQLSTALCLVSRLPAAATATSRCRSRACACVCVQHCVGVCCNFTSTKKKHRAAPSLCSRANENLIEQKVAAEKWKSLKQHKSANN